MAFDDVLKHLGEFGKYQFRVYILLMVAATVCGLHTVGSVFLQEKQEFRCLLPGEPKDAPYELPEDVKNESFPVDNVTGKYSSCSYLLDGEEVKCSGYVFNKPHMQWTVPMEWELVCDKAILMGIADTCYMLGALAGSIWWGYLSDTLGRRKVYIFALILLSVIGFLQAASPVYYFFVAMRFCTGTNTVGIYLISYVLALEMVGPSKRFIAGIGTHFFFAIGFVFITLFALIFKHWRYLQVCFTVMAVALISTWFWVPESVRWMISKGRLEEAKKRLLRVAQVNKTSIDPAVLDEILESESRSATEKKIKLIKVVKYPKTLRRSLVLFYNWAANSATYYGLSWGANALSGDLYINFTAMGLIEIPGYVIFGLVVDRFGRKYVTAAPLIFCGVLLLCTMAIPTSAGWAISTCSIIGKMAVTISYAAIFMVSSEIFPTAIRNSGVAAGSVVSRIGSMAAPQVNILSDYVFKEFPLLVYGGVSLTAGLAALYLPETMGKPLPMTLEEAEAFV